MIVEIFSDVVCPWCYIGKRRFESALERYDATEAVRVHWKAYQLDPAAPTTPEPVFSAYARKFGGAKQAEEIITRLNAVAASEGIDMRLDRALRTNTFDAHRVLWLAGLSDDAGLQGRLQERLMKAYFTDGVDIARIDMLTSLACETGMDRSEVSALFESDRGKREVRAKSRPPRYSSVCLCRRLVQRSSPVPRSAKFHRHV